MALADYSGTYAQAATDDDLLKKRRELANRLVKAKESGLTQEDVLRGEGYGLSGSSPSAEGGFDPKGINMDTGLSGAEIAGFVQRLYGKDQPLTGNATQGSVAAENVSGATSPALQPNPTSPNPSVGTLPPVGTTTGNAGTGGSSLFGRTAGADGTAPPRPPSKLDEYEQRPFGMTALREPPRRLGQPRRWDWWNER